MSEAEKVAANELVDNLSRVPADAKDYLRGYLRGRLDGIKAEEAEAKEE